MGGLSDAQEQKLARIRRGQRWARFGGLALTLLGLAYAGWGISRFDPRADPRVDPGFDRPVSRVANMYDRYNRVLDRVKPNTPTEQLLHDALKRNLNFGAGLGVLALRGLLGGLLMFAGLTAMTVSVERGRLLRFIDRLRE